MSNPCVRCVDSVDNGLSVFHGLPNALAPPGVWQSKLSDWAGPPGGNERCVYTHVCCCLAAGDVAGRIAGSSETNKHVDCCCGGVIGCAICAYCFFWGVTRTKLRNMYNIPGNSFADHILVLLFPPCYLSQALNHLDLAQQKPPGAPTAQVPYQPPPQLVMRH